jgi:dolichol-phosphate mannosyltransferase
VSPSDRIFVVIPTYNEAENLPLLVPEVLARDERIEVLVVDDNSPDGTGKIADDLVAENPRVHVLHRERKHGLGEAYRAGLRTAIDLGADLLVTMDADFSHPPATLQTLIEKIADRDVVMGSRYINGITVVNWPIERILISYYGNMYVRLFTRLPIRDTTGGFRIVRREMLERIHFDEMSSDGYAFQIELNYRFVKHGARWEEIEFFFLDRTRGESKLDLRIALECLWVAPWLKVADWLGRL